MLAIFILKIELKKLESKIGVKHIDLAMFNINCLNNRRVPTNKRTFFSSNDWHVSEGRRRSRLVFPTHIICVSGLSWVHELLTSSLLLHHFMSPKEESYMINNHSRITLVTELQTSLCKRYFLGMYSNQQSTRTSDTTSECIEIRIHLTTTFVICVPFLCSLFRKLYFGLKCNFS